ncbi:polysaccharide biosynthesis/export family protein [Tateyamaria sp.]|nr:polysaccharide biosynthesis/export family protein [Tateyamaria sp.]
MHYVIRIIILFFILSAVNACTLPRGAAIEDEITRSAKSGKTPFSVIPVSQKNISTLNNWPMTGSTGRYSWFTSPHGSDSNIIRSGDILNIAIWDNQANSLLTSPGQKTIAMNNIQVGSSGMIFIPYVDEVLVQGKTLEGARVDIQKQMELVVPSAQIQLSMIPGVYNSVDAVGGFNQPGTYPLPNRNYSILSMISKAGGISADLKNPLVRILRGNKRYEIRADSLYDRASANVVLRGGDKIIIEEDDRYFVGLGATGREEIVPFVREKITAIEGLAMLGGLDDVRANLQGILILREYKKIDIRTNSSGPNKTQVIFAIDLTSADGLFAARKFNINPKDLVMATESPVTSINTIFGIAGRLWGFRAIVN